MMASWVMHREYSRWPCLYLYYYGGYFLPKGCTEDGQKFPLAIGSCSTAKNSQEFHDEDLEHSKMVTSKALAS